MRPRFRAYVPLWAVEELIDPARIFGKPLLPPTPNGPQLTSCVITSIVSCRTPTLHRDVANVHGRNASRASGARQCQDTTHHTRIS